MATREQTLDVPEKLLAPLLVAIGLVPFVVEIWGTPYAPTLLFAAVLVVVATANFAFGLVRVGTATLAVGLASILSALSQPGVTGPAVAGLSLPQWALLAAALALLAWAIHAGEGERLAEYGR